MTLDNTRLLLKLDQVKSRLRATLDRGCRAFAFGGLGPQGLAGAGTAIVDDRFKGQGNARFTRLSPGYERFKAGQVAKEQRTGKAGPPGSDLVNRGRVTGKTGSKKVRGTSARGGGKNLPILVGPNVYRNGTIVHHGSTLREAVSKNPGHRIFIRDSGAKARVFFVGLPIYAKAHHLGLNGLPVRSPITPNLADKARMIAIMQRFLSASLGRNLGIG